MKRVQRYLWILIATLAVMLFAVPSWAGSTLPSTPPTDPSYTIMSGATLSETKKIDMWHYSGHYWKVTMKAPNAGTIQVADAVMGDVTDGYVASPITFGFTLPTSVQTAIAEGKTVMPVLRSGSSVPLSSYFDMSTATYTMAGNSISFTAKPKFNCIPATTLSFKTYGVVLNYVVPFVDSAYGYNMYSMFGDGLSGKQANGWVNYKNPYDTGSTPYGKLHPALVKDNTGALYGGSKIFANGTYHDSGKVNIGSGTFYDGGACGLCFEYPVEIDFYLKGTPPPPTEDPGEGEDPPTPPEPEKHICQKCGKCELTEEGICSATTCSCYDTPECGCYVAPPTINAVANLGLPQYTFVGHTVTATDNSTFKIEGVSYGAKYAYENGFASNSFSLTESGVGTISKSSNVTATAVFNQVGTFSVKLRVRPKGGSNLYDTKNIDVLKTPTIIPTLSGSQKENRKQVLNVSVATNPNRALTQLFIILRDPETGEQVKLIHNLNGTTNVLVNSNLFKTRPIEKLSSDAYFTNCKLEFLTKNNASVNLEYYIYAKDSAGLWDEVTTPFTVVPDIAPVAAITMEDSFLRNAGTNVAAIKAIDASTADGDQLQRTWTVQWANEYTGSYDTYLAAGAGAFTTKPAQAVESLAGFTDNSFGSRQSIQFNRTGVGKIKVLLTVKDVWTEDTLPEYITASDYLTASTSKITEVTNVAPKVSLKAVDSKTADVILLAGTDEDQTVLQNSVNDLAASLTENGIDANISSVKLSTTAKSGGIAALSSVTVPYGYATCEFWEQGSVLIDDYRLYKAEATWVDATATDNSHYEQPYKLKAYDASFNDYDDVGQTPLWTYVLSSSVINCPDMTSAYLSQDEDGKYLYWIVNGKTIIIDKKTGQQLAILSTEISKNACVGPLGIYSFQPDGIYRVSLQNGSVKKIYNGALSADNMRTLGGKKHFLVRFPGNVLARGIFDPKTEKVETQLLEETGEALERVDIHLYGVDTDGRMMVVGEDLGAIANDNSDNSVRIYVFESDNRLIHIGGQSGYLTIAESGVITANCSYICPVYDRGGRLHYYAAMRGTKNNTYYRGWVYLYGIDTSYVGSVDVKSSEWFPLSQSIIAAYENKAGDCTVSVGTERAWLKGHGCWCSVFNDRLPIDTSSFRFPANGEAAEQVSRNAGGITGLTEELEYGIQGDTYWAVSVGANIEKETGAPSEAYHTTNIMRIGQTYETLFNRYVNRYATGDADYTVVAVLDSVNWNDVNAEQITDFCDMMKSHNAHFLFGTTTDYTTYGTTLANAYERGKVLPGSAEGFVAGVKEYLLSESLAQSGNYVTRLQATTPAGAITKQFTLAPDTQYFYEYETTGQAKEKDMLNVSYSYAEAMASKGSVHYVVKDVFAEDFSDTELSPLVAVPEATEVKDGKYTTIEFSAKGDDHSGVYSGTFSITVPSGESAILEYDYLIESVGYSVGYLSSKVAGRCYVDGVKWDMSADSITEISSNNNITGHYLHRTLLTEGTHTIQCDLILYRTSGSSKKTTVLQFNVDNIKISLVKSEPISSAIGAAQAERSSSFSANGGWTKYSGSFTTPLETLDYAKIAGTTSHYSGTSAELATAGLVTQTTSGTSTAKTVPVYTATLPSEKTILQARFDTTGTAYYGSKGTTSLTYNASTINGATWVATKMKRYPTYLPMMRETETLYFYNMTNPVFTFQTSNNTRARGTVENMAFTLIDPADYAGPIVDGNWIYDSNHAVFGKNKTLQPTATFTLSPGVAGSYQLRNFRLYYMVNGTKVYLTDEVYPSASQGWTPNAGALSTVVQASGVKEEEVQQLVYKKGELVSFKINYSDYEKDPSKKQYWRYTHTPYNDGAHPDAAFVLNEDGAVVSSTGKVLNAAIPRFYVDGKYTVEHWQEDNTTRGAVATGQPNYDKASNVESITFYILGNGLAPWITNITTTPSPVKEEDAFKITVGVDDIEKDVLSLQTEVYFEGVKIYNHKKTNIVADTVTLKYPLITTDTVPELAKEGVYDVVCTVRDWSGVGLGTYRFTVLSEGKITGEVYHTDAWNANRKKYNTTLWGTEYNVAVEPNNYVGLAAPRKRGTNVFWSGERFMLQAAVAGTPLSVTCKILDTTYSTPMTATSTKNAAEETIYKAQLWDKSMMYKWGKTTPKILTFRFTATYDVVVKHHDVKVVVDNYRDYFLLHRKL